jgi:hypothetical protein
MRKQFKGVSENRYHKQDENMRGMVLRIRTFDLFSFISGHHYQLASELPSSTSLSLRSIFPQLLLRTHYSFPQQHDSE